MTLSWPMPCSTSHLFMAGMASFTVMPLRKPELTMMPVSSLATKASLLHVAALDHLDDGQAELLGKLPVALVVAGHAHDDAGAVAHEDIVGDEDGAAACR